MDNQTQALYSKGEDLICIIGPNRVQNNLLAQFLENETGFRISSYRKMTLSPIIDNSDYVSMILLDHSDIEGIRIRLSSNCKFHTNKVRGHVALFNVFRNQKNLEEVIKPYIQQGVHGIFYNDDPLPIIVKGIRAILNGELWFPRNILSVAMSDPKDRQYPDSSLHVGAQLAWKPYDSSIILGDFAWVKGSEGEIEDGDQYKDDDDRFSDLSLKLDGRFYPAGKIELYGLCFRHGFRFFRRGQQKPT